MLNPPREAPASKEAVKSSTNGGSSGFDREVYSPPSISLPKGGGAVRQIGEKFAANPVTGTASLSVPVSTTPGRSGFSPQLSLAYDSGNGNGPFGFGWRLSVPSITRKTDKGLPRYLDGEGSDVFILSDAEDLVPALLPGGGRDTFPASLHGAAYTVLRFRPRVEGIFARVERWCDDETGACHWRVTTRDNVTSVYGRSEGSRVADPHDSSRTFAWLLELTYDDTGGVILYEYKPEDRVGVPNSPHAENHEVAANRYLKRIKYGNRAPYYPDRAAPRPTPLPSEWHFQVVFDYGEHNQARASVVKDDPWPYRPDAFSVYRAGFEVRTHRLCRRVLMFHQFAELGEMACLVSSTDFAYEEGPAASFLTTVTQTGYIRNAADGSYEVRGERGELLSPKPLPPLDFTYTQALIDVSVRAVDAASLENLPAGLDGSSYRWVDLEGEGLPGILTEQAGAWFYKRNLGSLPRDDGEEPRPPAAARFAPVELLAKKPSLADLNGGRQQLLDLDGGGRLSLVQFARPVSGYYERAEDGEWQTFIPFASAPNVDWDDPNLRVVDLDGDGRAVILITEDEVFTWYQSRAKEGFAPAEVLPKGSDEAKGAALVFADGTQSVHLADMSGDGLTDIVRVRNGEVCYWPNLGYGRFGPKITMDGAPVFDRPDQFDEKRLRLADLDGSGVTDIVYLGRDAVTLWFNQSGNGWSEPRRLHGLPAADELTYVSVFDLLGNGELV